MIKCICGREFKTEQIYNMHKPYCKGPRYCQNPECNKLLVKNQIKFCSASCSAKITQIGKKHSLERRKNISIGLGGSGEVFKVKEKIVFFKNKILCKCCGVPTINKKYCSKQCSVLGSIPKEYENKNFKMRKEILWEEQGKKCNHCGYNLYDYITGPYEIHHIDGNNKNHKRENEELICCNCHFMTDNYRFKNRKHTKESKKLISKNWNPPNSP